MDNTSIRQEWYIQELGPHKLTKVADLVDRRMTRDQNTLAEQRCSLYREYERPELVQQVHQAPRRMIRGKVVLMWNQSDAVGGRPSPSMPCWFLGRSVREMSWVLRAIVLAMTGFVGVPIPLQDIDSIAILC